VAICSDDATRKLLVGNGWCIQPTSSWMYMPTRSWLMSMRMDEFTSGARYMATSMPPIVTQIITSSSDVAKNRQAAQRSGNT